MSQFGREPGYYWIRVSGLGWQPALWSSHRCGDYWNVMYSDEPLEEHYIIEVGPRLTPPDEVQTT